MATSSAAKKAACKYRAKKDQVVIYLPAGTAAAVRAQGVSVSGLCCDLVARWLADRGIVIDSSARPSVDAGQGETGAQDQQTAPQGERIADNVEQAQAEQAEQVQTDTQPETVQGVVNTVDDDTQASATPVEASGVASYPLIIDIIESYKE